MATVIVEVREGETAEQKWGLIRDITEVVCAHFCVGPERVRVYLQEKRQGDRPPSRNWPLTETA